MQLLEEKILKDGVIKSGNVLKVDSFLNHQIDVPFIAELGKEFKRQFADRPINKILTIDIPRADRDKPEHAEEIAEFIRIIWEHISKDARAALMEVENDG